MKKITFFSIVVFSFLFYGIYLSVYQLKVRQVEIKLRSDSPYFDYRGVTNVHSSVHSGSGTYSEILNYAKNAKLDFLAFTDLNLPARPFFTEGYSQDVLTMAGGMYSYFDCRLLYYGGEEAQPPPGQSQTQVFFADLLSRKHAKSEGFVVLAHPFYSRFTWKGDYPPGLDGVEVINLKSVLEKRWRDSKLRTIWSLFLYPFNPTLAFLNIYRNPIDELVLWDQLNKKYPVVGIAGNDTTARIDISDTKVLKFPSYETVFGLVSNHILTSTELTGDFLKDKNKILNALQKGQFYFALDILGNPKGFYAEVGDGEKTYPMGSEIKFSKNLKMHVQMPPGMLAQFQVHILKDGEEFFSSNSMRSIMNITAPGNYRIEVKVNPRLPPFIQDKWVPWIYTNNFYIH